MKKIIKQNEKNNLLKLFFGFFSIFILFTFLNFNSVSHSYIMGFTMSEMQMQSSLMNSVNSLKSKLIDEGKYKCCLKNPCSYCLLEDIEKTEFFDGKKLECECLVEIMEGKSPCPECVGEILDGEGNKYIAKYFATAIAQKTGNKEVIKKIIKKKYGIPINEQI